MVGTTLICAIGIPSYTQFALGQEWLGQLPVFLRLLLTNTVVLAVMLAISLNLIMNIILRGDEEEPPDES